MNKRAEKLKKLRDRIKSARPRMYDTGPGADFDVGALDSGRYLDFAAPPTDILEVSPEEVEELEPRPRPRDPYMDAVPVDPDEVEVLDVEMYADSPDDPVVVGEGDVEVLDDDPRDTDACTYRRSSVERKRRSATRRIHRAAEEQELDLSALGDLGEVSFDSDMDPDAIPDIPGSDTTPLDDAAACPPGCAPVTTEETVPAVTDDDDGIVDVDDEDVKFLDEEGDERAKSSETMPELGEEVTAATEDGTKAEVEDSVEAVTEQPKEAEVKTDSNVVEVLASLDSLADARSEQVELVLTQEQAADPRYVVLVEGEPVAKVALSDQPETFTVDHPDMFMDPTYPQVVLENVDKLGLLSTLNSINARFYAAHAEQGVVAQQMRTAAVEDLRQDHHKRLAEMKDSLINTANLVIEASIKNYILDNPLRDELVREVQAAGVAPKAALDLVERALHTRASDYFRTILAKAEEWLGAPPEALQHHVKEIAGMNYRHPGYDSLDQEMEFTEERVAEVRATPKNVPIRSRASAPRSPAASTTDREYWKRELNLHGMLVQKSLSNTPYKR